jgi:hypothetical protein
MIKDILKDCFWEYDFSEDDIKKLANSDNFQEKSFLFQKILLNSRSFLKELKIFDRNDLKILLENFKVPEFNKEYIFKRKNMAEVYFFDKPLKVDELKWIV